MVEIKLILVWIIYTVAEPETDTTQQALEYVFRIRQSDDCGRGTSEVLPLEFDVTAWNQYTDPAIRTANLLSKLIVTNDGTLDALTDKLFFMMVENNVHGDSLIFGSAIAIEPGVYSKYEIFCPYAYKKNDTVRSHDISINYNYRANTTEWYNSVKIKPWTNVTIVTDGVKYRNGNELLPEIEIQYPLAELPDGHWTNPYFDCGGGDIWMVTYSSPIFHLQQDVATFLGVATIDIELTNIDINQCDGTSTRSTGLDVFRGTHRCQDTTKCDPVTGKGFIPGAYLCLCVDGFYFPDLSSQIRAFTGEDIEQHFRQHGRILDKHFRCTACAAGCDTCTDGSPCLHQRNEPLLISLLLLNALTAVGIVLIAVATFMYRRELVFKSASPIFLQLMCLGGLLMCAEFFTQYGEASELMCIVRLWLKHLGFFILFGSLILKTWRISVIFSVGMQKRVRLPDQVLLQRFCVVLLFAVGIIAAWSGSHPPGIDTLKTDDLLKFYVCSVGAWDYAVIGVEIAFLLYGVYLCFTVRKAPAHFNESKHITWAVYNAIILGSVMALMLRVVTSVIGPDVMLVLIFVQLHVYSTITVLLIFCPKFFALKRKTGDPGLDTGTLNTVQTVTGRMKTAYVAPRQNDNTEDVGTQTD